MYEQDPSKGNETSSEPSRLFAARKLAEGAMTLFITPEHKTHHRTMEERMLGSPQPLQPSIGEVAESVAEVMQARDLLPLRPSFSLAGKLASAARMIQFTDHYMHTEEGHFTLPFAQVDQLKSRFVQRASSQQMPLDYAQQLDEALEISRNDVVEAGTLLCYGSRFYARWLDTTMMKGMPPRTDEQALHEMTEWRTTLRAPKDDSEGFQDPSGDTYYTWTHVLGALTFSGEKLHDRVGRSAFTHGTKIMHAAVHTFNKQSVPNDHRVAAEYGNAIGAVITSKF